MEADHTTNQTTPTLGFLTPRLGTHQGGILDSYPEAVWNGIAQAAQESNANVLCFVGADLNSPLRYYKDWNARQIMEVSM